MSSVNIKSFILSTIKPWMLSLQSIVSKDMQATRDRVDSQNAAVSELQTHISAIQEAIAKIDTRVLKCENDISSLTNQLYTSSQIATYTMRLRETSFICSQLYDIIEDLKKNGSSTIVLPDKDHPIWTADEVEAEFRARNGIAEDVVLTEEQQSALTEFMTTFFEDNPQYTLADEDYEKLKEQSEYEGTHPDYEEGGEASGGESGGSGGSSDEPTTPEVDNTIYLSCPAYYKGVANQTLASEISVACGDSTGTYTLTVTLTNCKMIINGTTATTTYTAAGTIAAIGSVLGAAKVVLGSVAGSVKVQIGTTSSTIATVIEADEADPAIALTGSASFSGYEGNTVALDTVVSGGNSTDSYTLTVTVTNTTLVVGTATYTDTYTVSGTVSALNQILSKMYAVVGATDGSITFTCSGATLTTKIEVTSDPALVFASTADSYEGAENSTHLTGVTLSGGNNTKTYAFKIIPTNCVILLDGSELEGYAATLSVADINAILTSAKIKLGSVSGSVVFSCGDTAITVSTVVTQSVVDETIEVASAPTSYSGEEGASISCDVEYSSASSTIDGTLVVTPTDASFVIDGTTYTSGSSYSATGTVAEINDILAAATIVVGSTDGSVKFSYGGNVTTIAVIVQASSSQEGGQDDSDTTVDIVLGDTIKVNGSDISTDTTSDVYLANDVIYYENRTTYDSGNLYGAGTSADMHTAEEAAAVDVIHITAPGTYNLSGTHNSAQVYVNLGDGASSDSSKVVTLNLNGVTLKNTVAPAILVTKVYESDQAWRAYDDGETIEYTASMTQDTSDAGFNLVIADGTTNTVIGSHVAKIYKDTADMKKLYKFDGAIHCRKSMNVSGNGSLTINADNEGLDSELHMTINAGNIFIYSNNDAINVNEDNVSVFTMNGGVLHCEGGLGSEGDGIDSNGYLVINGGYVYASANPGADCGMDADLGIFINGGYVVSFGSIMDAPDSGSAQRTIWLKFAQNRSAGSNLIIANSSKSTEFAYVPSEDSALKNTRAYQAAIISAPTFTSGNHYAYSGGTIIGEPNALGMYTSTQSVATAYRLTQGNSNSTTFNLSTKVNSFSNVKVSSTAVSY